MNTTTIKNIIAMAHSTSENTNDSNVAVLANLIEHLAQELLTHAEDNVHINRYGGVLMPETFPKPPFEVTATGPTAVSIPHSPSGTQYFVTETDKDQEAYKYYLNPENRQPAGPGRRRVMHGVSPSGQPGDNCSETRKGLPQPGKHEHVEGYSGGIEGW